MCINMGRTIFWANLDGDSVCSEKPERVEELSDTWVAVSSVTNIQEAINKAMLEFPDTDIGVRSRILEELGINTN